MEQEFSLFVGDLAYDVHDAMLENVFRAHNFPTVKSAKVMVDPVTSRSRGFGFVRFSDEAERDRAINDMNGVVIGSKAVRVSLATARPNAGATRSNPVPLLPGQLVGEADPTNTTLFVGGLSAGVTEAELHAAFAPCGDIVYTKIPPGKGCGFVQFVHRHAAEHALERMNGYLLGGTPIRVSFGKSSRPPGPGVHLGLGASLGPATVQLHHPAASALHHPAAYGAFYAPTAGYAAYGAPPGTYSVFSSAASPYNSYTGMHDPTFAGYSFVPTTALGTPMASPASTQTNIPVQTSSGSATGPTGGYELSMGSGAVGNTNGALAGNSNIDISKLNMTYAMQRHMPVIAGHHLRLPMAMPVHTQPM